MPRESGLRQSVSGLLRDNGFFTQAIENDVGDGVPDLWYSHKVSALCSVSGWLELKKIKEMPKRATTSLFASINHPLSYTQANWISLCLRAGGRADILVGYGREYFFVPGELADEFNEFTESRLRKFTVTRSEIVSKLKAAGC